MRLFAKPHARFWLWESAWLCCLLALCALLVPLAVRGQHRASLAEASFASGFFAPETTENTTIRWASGRAALVLPNPGGSSVASIELAGGPERSIAVTVRTSNRAVELALTPEIRRYSLLLPAQDAPTYRVQLISPTFSEGPDGRTLGAVVGAVQVAGGSAMPGWMLPPLLALAGLAYAVLRQVLRHGPAALALLVALAAGWWLRANWAWADAPAAVWWAVLAAGGVLAVLALWRHRQRLRAFGPLVLAIGAVYAAASLWIIAFTVRYARTILFADQWDYYTPLFRDQGWFGMLIYKHGPHRQGLGGLLLALGAALSGWDARVDAWMVAAIVVLAAGAALALMRRVRGHWSPADLLVPLVVLSTAAYESLTVVPNPAHSALPLLLGILVPLAWSLRRPAWRYGSLALLDLALIFTGFGLFMGLLIPALLALELVHLLVRRSPAWRGPALGLAASLANWWLFSLGYRFSSAISCYVFPHPRPWEYVQFVAVMLARFVGLEYSRTPELALAVGGALGCGVLVAALWAGWSLLRSGPSADAGTRAAALFLAAGLIFCANTAVGRVCAGIDGGQSSRYMLLVAPMFLGLLLLASQISAGRVRLGALVVLAALLLPVPLPGRASNEAAARGYAQAKLAWQECYLELGSLAECSQRAHLAIYPDPASVQPKLDFLEARQVNIFQP